MTLRSSLFLAFSFFFLIAHAQTPPAIEWQKTLGGSIGDLANSIQQTADGGFIVAGYTSSNDGDVSGNHGGGDYWVVKLDNTGNLIWQKVLGGTGADGATSIHQTTDGGYIVAGSTLSNNGDVSGNHGNRDCWVVKLEGSGNLIWQKTLGGTDIEIATSIQQTADGGYIMVGVTNSNDGDVSGNHGSGDFWVVKLDNTGNLIWQKTLGGSIGDVASSIQQTADGGYILAGYTSSNDGDVSGNHGDSDYWVVKLDNTGNLIWQKALGGSNSDGARSIQQTTDGGFIVAGYTNSNDGDVSGNHGFGDFWVVKLNNTGNLIWQKALGGSDVEDAHYVQQTADGGFIVAGYTRSSNGNVTGNHGGDDYWAVKLNGAGNLVWQKALGGSDTDRAYSIQQTADGAFIMAGSTLSNNGEVSGNHGGGDFWVIKLASETSIGVEELAGTSEQDGSLSVFPNPTTGEFTISIERSFMESILITDAVGREVLRKGVNKNSVSVDLAAHPQGAYFLIVRTVDGLTVKKIVIKR